jgi:hypothetical protein
MTIERMYKMELSEMEMEMLEEVLEMVEYEMDITKVYFTSSEMESMYEEILEGYIRNEDTVRGNRYYEVVEFMEELNEILF